MCLTDGKADGGGVASPPCRSSPPKIEPVSPRSHGCTKLEGAATTWPQILVTGKRPRAQGSIGIATHSVALGHP
eukprot:551666-Amphidinium_carterae.1